MFGLSKYGGQLTCEDDRCGKIDKSMRIQIMLQIEVKLVNLHCPMNVCALFASLILQPSSPARRHTSKMPFSQMLLATRDPLLLERSLLHVLESWDPMSAI